MSLRARLAILYATLTGGILLLFGVLVYSLVGFIFINNADTLLRQAVVNILDVTNTNNQGELESIVLPQLNNLTANVLYQLWNTDKTLNTASNELGNLPVSLDPANLQFSQVVYDSVTLQDIHMRVLTVPLKAGERPIGILQVATSLVFIDNALHDLVYLILAAALLSMILAGLAGWFGIGQALSPIKTVTETALQITRADDLSRRIPYDNQANDEMGQLISAFNETLEQLERLFTSQQRFLADVSHELRTPLTVIKGNANLMRRMGEADEESLASIEQEADRLTRMVGDLLTLIQAEVGKLPLEMRPVELDTLLLTVSKEMAVLARDRVQVKVTEIDQVLVLGDHDRLKQVLLNLVSNAITYSPAGGEVLLSLVKVGSQARLIVRDTGQGIPAEDLPHIFERFYRAEKSRTRAKISGFGLGLSIAYWIVNNHGGLIEVDSKEGQGTTFCIYLPLLTEENQGNPNL